MKNTSSDQPVLDCYKVQCDVTGTSILIYNEERSFVGSTTDKDVVNKLKSLFDLGTMNKKYVTGYIDADGVFHVDEVVPDQDW